MATKEQKLLWIRVAEKHMARATNSASNKLIQQIYADELQEIRKYITEIDKTEK